jgi:hypothetical protein
VEVLRSDQAAQDLAPKIEVNPAYSAQPSRLTGESACRPGSDRSVSLTCGYFLKLALSCTFVSQRLSTFSGIFGVLAEQSRNSDTVLFPDGPAVQSAVGRPPGSCAALAPGPR